MEQNNKDIKKKKQAEETKKFKASYYDYYDDVKSHTHQVYDW